MTAAELASIMHTTVPVIGELVAAGALVPNASGRFDLVDALAGIAAHLGRVASDLERRGAAIFAIAAELEPAVAAAMRPIADLHQSGRLSPDTALLVRETIETAFADLSKRIGSILTRGAALSGSV